MDFQFVRFTRSCRELVVVLINIVKSPDLCIKSKASKLQLSNYMKILQGFHLSFSILLQLIYVL